jgi:5-methylcytosine-specific restriction endonuclease McrA
VLNKLESKVNKIDTRVGSTISVERIRGYKLVKIRERIGLRDCYTCQKCGRVTVKGEVDHINNDGNEHRKKIGRSGRTLVYWIVVNNFPDGFQLLCSNCNQGKRRNGGICPHKK